MSILLFRSSNILHQLKKKNDKEKPLLHGWDAFHVAAVLTVVIISFVFLISGDNLFLPLVRPV